MSKLPIKPEIKILRERFIIDFCKKRGWNHKELTTGQMMMIINHPDYKIPLSKFIR